jgi:hypothetical protein
MSMQALNQLVARSIVDPGIMQSFCAGTLGDVLADMDFSTELRTSLAGLHATSFTEFAVLAYRNVKAAERLVPRVQLPSPLDGLLLDNGQTSQEQVA